jgi:hypothetical protein
MTATNEFFCLDESYCRVRFDEMEGPTSQLSLNISKVTPFVIWKIVPFMRRKD